MIKDSEYELLKNKLITANKILLEIAKDRGFIDNLNEKGIFNENKIDTYLEIVNKIIEEEDKDETKKKEKDKIFKKRKPEGHYLDIVYNHPKINKRLIISFILEINTKNKWLNILKSKRIKTTDPENLKDFEILKNKLEHKFNYTLINLNKHYKIKWNDEIIIVYEDYNNLNKIKLTEIVKPDNYKNEVDNTKIKEFERKLNKYINIQYFHLNELQYNLTKHVLVPKHIKLSKIEKESIIKKYEKNLDNFPILYINDPVSKYYCFKPNDLIEIKREYGFASDNNANTVISDSFYRLIKSSEEINKYFKTNGIVKKVEDILTIEVKDKSTIEIIKQTAGNLDNIKYLKMEIKLIKNNLNKITNNEKNKNIIRVLIEDILNYNKNFELNYLITKTNVLLNIFNKKQYFQRIQNGLKIKININKYLEKI